MHEQENAVNDITVNTYKLRSREFYSTTKGAAMNAANEWVTKNSYNIELWELRTDNVYSASVLYMKLKNS